MREKITIDLKNAMKNQNKELLSVIRMLKGAIQLEEIKVKKELTDEEIIDIVTKQIKMRKESIAEFKKGDRLDLATATEKEIVLLSKYMPVQLSQEEVTKIIDEAFDKIKPEKASDMGLIMKEVTDKLKGKTDMSNVSKIIKDRLN